jgi:hypothetical protein
MKTIVPALFSRNNRAMSGDVPTSEEVVERGERIYDESLRSKLEPEHLGKFVVVNVETGEYELDKNHMAAVDRARARRWPAELLYATRVGSRYLWRMGGRIKVRKP